MEEKPQAPGLEWDRGRPVWRASRAAKKAGYPITRVSLSGIADNHALIIQRCLRLQAEMRAWLSGRSGYSASYDGTVRALLECYQTDEQSTYQKLKPSARHPYDVYLRLLIMEVGARRIDAIDGRDLTRWHKAWSRPAVDGGKPRLAAARMVMCVLKAALSFGITCRYAGCAELKAIMNEMTFAAPRPRKEAPTAAQITAARREAMSSGHRAAALAYAIQFEGQVRQWDVIGEWLPLDDKRPSAIISRGKKWVGPTWAQIDENLIWRLTPEKTADTSEARVVLDLRTYPMVMEELADVPPERRTGPVIVNPRTGLPYRQHYFRNLWRKVATAAGIDKAVWNRDLRAGGITEAREAGALTDDVAKTAGHSDKRTTARVYDRDRLEAARRVARARSAHRSRNEG